MTTFLVSYRIWILFNYLLEFQLNDRNVCLRLIKPEELYGGKFIFQTGAFGLQID